MRMNRFAASGIHLAGSVLVACIAAALVFLVWYPAPLAWATGVVPIFLLMLGVDVVLGPCITLIIFNPARKKMPEIRRDLLLVLLVQLAALGYGLHSVFVARPVYIVFNTDRFDLVYANDITKEKLEQVQDERFRRAPLFGPKIVAARRPEDPDVRQKLMFSALAGGDDLPQMPQFYVPYEAERGTAVARIQPLNNLLQHNQGKEQALVELKARYPNEPEGVGYLPLRAREHDLSMIVGRETARVLEVNRLSPW